MIIRDATLTQDPKNKFRIEPFPGPRAHSLVIEIGCDLAAIQTNFFQSKHVVYQGLMSRVKIHPGQRLGLDGNPKTEAVFRRPLKPFKGKSEITPP